MCAAGHRHSTWLRHPHLAVRCLRRCYGYNPPSLAGGGTGCPPVGQGSSKRAVSLSAPRGEPTTRWCWEDCACAEESRPTSPWYERARDLDHSQFESVFRA